MDVESGSNLVSDSCGQTPAKSMDRKSKTTRFYGVSFLRGKIEGSEVKTFYQRNRKVFDDQEIIVCCFTTMAIFIIILGVSLALAGHFTPRKKLVDSTSSNGTRIDSNIHVILHYNHMLETFALSGMVLLAVGVIMFILIITTSLCYTYEVKIQRNKGYNELASGSDTEEMILLNNTRTGDQVANGNTQESPAEQFTTIHKTFKPSELNSTSQ